VQRKGDSGWPADHAIGVYLSVGDHKTLVATARSREDVGPMLRYLADSWDTLQRPPVLPADSSWLYDAHVDTSLSG